MSEAPARYWHPLPLHPDLCVTVQASWWEVDQVHALLCGDAYDVAAVHALLRRLRADAGHAGWDPGR